MKAVFSGASKHFSLERLTEGVYAAIHSEGGAAVCNAGLIDLGNLIVAFDTFIAPQAALELRRFSLEIFGRAPQLVVNSHYHNDHTWGNQAFIDDAMIMSSRRTRELFETEGKEELDSYRDNLSRQMALVHERLQSAQDEQERRALLFRLAYYEVLAEALPTLRPCGASLTFDGGVTLHGEERSAELITFEGAHTASDTVLFLPSDGVLFAGDLLFVKAHPYLSEGDPRKLISALKALSGLGASCYVPGHGGIGEGEDVSALIRYSEFSIESAGKAIEDGLSADVLQDVRIPDFCEDWLMPHMFHENLKSAYGLLLVG